MCTHTVQFEGSPPSGLIFSLLDGPVASFGQHRQSFIFYCLPSSRGPAPGKWIPPQGLHLAQHLLPSCSVQMVLSGCFQKSPRKTRFSHAMEVCVLEMWFTKIQMQQQA